MASPSKGNPDLLRTALLFNVVHKAADKFSATSTSHKKDVSPEDFDLIAEVQAGKLTTINDNFQILSRKYKPEEIEEFVNKRDEDGKTALFYACYYNYQNIVLYLLTRGADPFLADNKDRNCFHILGFKGLTECIILILNFLRHKIRKSALASLKRIKKDYGFLKSDIKNGILVSPNQSLQSVQNNFNQFMPKVEEVFATEYLHEIYKVQEKAIGKFDDVHRSPIHYAAMSKYTRCGQAIKLLLLNFHDKLEGYPFFEEMWDELQFLELNVEKREETNSATKFLEWIENYLSETKYNELVGNFNETVSKLQHKVTNTQDADGYTPMHLASFYGDFLSVQFMRRLGADEHIKDFKDGKQVLDYAANGMVRSALIDLKEAARQGDAKSFDHLLNCGNKIDERKTIFTIAPIHNAIQYVNKAKKQDLLDFVIKCGANLNISDGSGWTPLHYACQNGDLDTVNNLIKNEANINAFSNKHFYPLHVAALNNHAHVIEFLVDKGAKLECLNDEKCTPLLLAARKGHCESLKTLLDLGANIYAGDIRNWTSLHYAAYNGHGKAVKLLCKYDADYEKLRTIENTQGKTAKEICPNMEVKFEFNTLWKAALDGNLDIVRRLHRFGEDIDAQTRELKLTPLMIATRGHHLLVVKYLLENNANRELKDSNDKKAIEYAVEAKGHIKTNNSNIRSIFLNLVEGERYFDQTKATKYDYVKGSNISFFTLIFLEDGKKIFHPDLVSRIEKTLKLFGE